jgi:hypothetical protein
MAISNSKPLMKRVRSLVQKRIKPESRMPDKNPFEAFFLTAIKQNVTSLELGGKYTEFLTEPQGFLQIKPYFCLPLYPGTVRNLTE